MESVLRLFSLPEELLAMIVELIPFRGISGWAKASRRCQLLYYKHFPFNQYYVTHSLTGWYRSTVFSVCILGQLFEMCRLCDVGVRLSASRVFDAWRWSQRANDATTG